MTLDHVVLSVTNVEASRRFYDAALAPLGLKVTKQHPGMLGYGREEGRAHFWIVARNPVTRDVHIAFVAADHAAVDAFHAAALETGGRDNGPPGPREHYHPGYYGGFVLDPEGNNIEAVCR